MTVDWDVEEVSVWKFRFWGFNNGGLMIEV